MDGDADSLVWLVERFSPLLHACAARRLGPPLRAQYDPADVVLDVWVAVLTKLGALELRKFLSRENDVETDTRVGRNFRVESSPLAPATTAMALGANPLGVITSNGGRGVIGF